MDFIVNVVILVMLAVMIGYCIVLNSRLKAFRNMKQELGEIINQLNASTSHAQKSISEFKNVVFEEEKKLADKLKEASEMADELDMINQTGSNLADRIEKGLTGDQKQSAEENLTVIGDENKISERISLSDLDKEESRVDQEDNLRESIRNIR